MNKKRIPKTIQNNTQRVFRPSTIDHIVLFERLVRSFFLSSNINPLFIYNTKSINSNFISKLSIFTSNIEYMLNSTKNLGLSNVRSIKVDVENGIKLNFGLSESCTKENLSKIVEIRKNGQPGFRLISSTLKNSLLFESKSSSPQPVESISLISAKGNLNAM